MMNKQQERIEQLVERWYAAQTTDTEERELRDWFAQAKQVPDSLRMAQQLFGGLRALAEEHLPVEQQPIQRRIWPRWGVVAAAAVVIGIVICAELLRKPYCYIDGVAIYDKEIALQTTSYFTSFAALGESERMVDELMENN